MLDLEILSGIYSGDKHDFDGSARENTSEPVNLSPSYMDIRRITCLDRMFFLWEQRTYESISIYIFRYRCPRKPSDMTWLTWELPLACYKCRRSDTEMGGNCMRKTYSIC